nr:unnamed protein product [Callosobruchus chinensis]
MTRLPLGPLHTCGCLPRNGAIAARFCLHTTCDLVAVPYETVLLETARNSRTATGRNRNGAKRKCASFNLFLSTLARNCGAVAALRGKQPQVCSGS